MNKSQNHEQSSQKMIFTSILGIVHYDLIFVFVSRVGVSPLSRDESNQINVMLSVVSCSSFIIDFYSILSNLKFLRV